MERKLSVRYFFDFHSLYTFRSRRRRSAVARRRLRNATLM
jgi:hypothetical protein